MVERLRTDAASAQRSVLTPMETYTLLTTFSLPVPQAAAADTLAEARAAARRLGYPGDAALRHERGRLAARRCATACAMAGC